MTQQYLNEIFEYRDGMIFYRVRTARWVKIGQRAGCLRKDGYRSMLIKRVNNYEHRIIWIMHNGPIPEGFEIDHRDNNRSNNLIDNLRLATNAQNQYNKYASTTSISKLKGVHYHKITNRWYAKICINGKYKHLGSFGDKRMAFERYKKEADLLHGEFVKY